MKSAASPPRWTRTSRPAPPRSGSDRARRAGCARRWSSCAGSPSGSAPLLANDAIDLTVDAGEVLALLGENGAGKSTLTRILYGLSRADAGEIRIAGQPVTMSSPADALAAGIGMVTQEFTLVGPMTVTENLMLAGSPLGRIDREGRPGPGAGGLERLGVPVDPDAVVERLSVGERQRVEILKALLGDCRVLVLDEPTAVLVPADVELLFAPSAGSPRRAWRWCSSPTSCTRWSTSPTGSSMLRRGQRGGRPARRGAGRRRGSPR